MHCCDVILYVRLTNEWYAKDCSRKVKSAFRTKALNGEYTGGYPAYGYQKDPADRHRLIPDKHAPIVQRMFRMALQGETCFHIAKTLETEQIPTPRAYLMDEYGKYRANERVKHPYTWGKTTVRQILSNPIYFGKLVSQRYQTKAFKDKRIVPRSENEWITVEAAIPEWCSLPEKVVNLSDISVATSIAGMVVRSVPITISH